jgi:hypothetical protein
MQVVLPEEALPAKLTLNPELRMNDDEYYDFCMANANVRFERTAQGEIIIVPPGGANPTIAASTCVSSWPFGPSGTGEERYLVQASLFYPVAQRILRMLRGCRMSA